MYPGWICTTLKVKVGLPAVHVAPTETTWPQSSHQALILGHLLRLLTEVDKARNLLLTGGSDEQNSNFQNTFQKPELSMQILSLGALSMSVAQSTPKRGLGGRPHCVVANWEAPQMCQSFLCPGNSL